MAIARRTWSPFGLAFLAIAGVLETPGSSHAQEAIAQCAGAAVCTSQFSVEITPLNGGVSLFGFGQLIYNSETGEIGIDPTGQFGPTNGMFDPNTGGLMWDGGEGLTAGVLGLGGNADPNIVFGVGSTTGAAGAAFSFTFNLPIAMQGQVFANSSLGYTLTARPGAGFAQISPFGASPALVLEALDVDTGGPLPLAPIVDKNVDVGPTFNFTDPTLLGLTQNSGPYTAQSFFNISSEYDLMTVRLSYILSPNNGVGLSGFVSQVIVPLPAALPLLLSGLAGFGALARRRSRLTA